MNLLVNIITISKGMKDNNNAIKKIPECHTPKSITYKECMWFLGLTRPMGLKSELQHLNKSTNKCVFP